MCRRRRSAIPFILLGIALLAGCGKKIDSQWRGERQVEIDGKDVEWEDARVYIEDANVGIGLLNDEQDLYLSLSLTDRTAQFQVMSQGFTVWFDPQGKKNKTFGIRFPLGLQDRMMDGMERGEPPEGGGMRGRGGGNMGGARRGMSAERLQAMFERLTRIPEMEILGPNQPYDKQRLLFSESEDIQLKVAYDYGRLVYELKVPLARIAPGADLKGGQSIGLGFETTKVDRQAMRQRMGGMGGGMGGRGGGMGGMGGGMGGRGGRRGGGMGGMMAEPFQLWAKVKLASR